jgi:hypothetical protein
LRRPVRGCGQVRRGLLRIPEKSLRIVLSDQRIHLAFVVLCHAQVNVIPRAKVSPLRISHIAHGIA